MFIYIIFVFFFCRRVFFPGIPKNIFENCIEIRRGRSSVTICEREENEENTNEVKLRIFGNIN